MTTFKDIPKFVAGDLQNPSSMLRKMEQMREAMQLMIGTRGGNAGQTAWGSALAGGVGSGTGVGSVVVLPPTGSSDMTPPPAPTSVTASGGITYLYVEWDAPFYTQGGGNSYTTIYGATYDPVVGGPLPTFANAVELGSVNQGTSLFAHPTNPASQWHVWVTFTTFADVEGPPGGGTNGASATTGQDVATLLKALQGEITASELNASLTTRINLIDAPTTGLVAKVADLQTTYGSTASAATSASNASTSATNASNSATAANNSAVAATAAKDAALGSAGAAAGSASSASASASSAATSASTASTQAGVATTKAAEASTSAGTAATAATSASGSATAAATSYSQIQAVVRAASLGKPFSQWVLNGQTLQTVSDGKVGTQVLRLASFAGHYPNQGDPVPIDRTKKYRVRFWARPQAGANGLLYFSLRQFLDAAGASPGPLNGGRFPYLPGAISRAAHNAQFGVDQWGEYTYVWDSSTWQDGVTHVHPEFLDNYDGNTGYWEVQDFEWTNATTTEALSVAVAQEATARAASDGQLFAQWTVKLDVNGYVSGFGLASTSNNATPSSSFIVRADRFAVASPSGPGIIPATPFIVRTTDGTVNGVAYSAGVYIDAAYILDLTAPIARMGDAWIDNAKIANLDASKINTGTLDAKRIGANSITAMKIDSRGLSIKDASGNVILAAGSAIPAGYMTWANVGSKPGTDAQMVRNLIDSSTWVVGSTGSQPGFNVNANTDTTNQIVMDVAPDGIRRPIWCATSGTLGAAQGGWDPGVSATAEGTKTYRFAVWFQATARQTGTLYLGMYSAGGLNVQLAEFSTGIEGNPYFNIIGKSSLVLGRWYLAVGYVFPYIARSVQYNHSGIYDGVTGQKIYTGQDMCFTNSGGGTIGLRTYQFYTDGAGGDIAQWWGPRIELCDGSEPAIQQLLAPAIQSQVNSQSGVTLINDANMTIVGNTATKTGGTPGAWDSAFHSKDSYTGGAYVSFVPAQSTQGFVVGLNSDPTTNNDWGSLDFAIYCNSNATYDIRESGSNFAPSDGGAYVAGDVFSVTYDGSTVRYFHNGNLVGSRVATITAPLFADSSFREIGAKATSIQFGPMSSNNWASVGGAGKPADNATVGATWGTNLTGIPANVSNALNRTGDSIQGRINLTVADGLFAGTDLNNGVYLGNTGLVGKKGGATTFAVDTAGNAYFSGTLNIVGTASDRLEITNSVIKVFAGGVVRVKIGNLA